MKNLEIKARENEPRKDYLIRVAVAYLKEVDHTGAFATHYPDTIIYDEADCDGECLAEDLENEFSHIEFDDLTECEIEND
jgi:hypothetical protein